MLRSPRYRPHPVLRLGTLDLGLGLDGLRLGVADLAANTILNLSWRWQDYGRWLEEDFGLRVGLPVADS